MEWNFGWTAVGSLAAVASVFAIIFVRNQLRFNAWLKAQDVFTSDDFVNAQTLLFAHFDDPKKPWPNHQSNYAKKVCRQMDEMAHLIPFLGRRKALQVWGNPIAKAWLLLKYAVCEERKTSHWCEKWSAFEKLGKAAVEQNLNLKKRRKDVPPYTP